MSLATDPTEPFPRRCPRGHRLSEADGSLDLCPVCLLGMGLADEPEPPCLPVRFGGYDLLDKLGEGGGGVVYMARQRSIGRVVALKRMRDGELADAAAQRRFLKEVKAAAQLHHPHIVPIHDVGEHDGEPYFTMELMSGGTLKDAAERFNDPRRAAALVSKLARAVHAIHTAQAGHPERIVHRDLKPGNILFDDRDNPYIADFGIARRLDGDSSGWTDEAAGTVHYMAPERAHGQAKQPTVAADVWSLGVILYELIAEWPPFDGSTPLEVHRCAAEDEPEPIERVRPDVGRDLSTVCLTCLHKEPERRYISAEALADDLDRCLRGEPPKARRPSLVTRAVRCCQRHPALTLAFAGTFIALLIASAVAFSLAAARKAALIEATQASNAWGAHLVAMHYQAKLERASRIVANVAERPELKALLKEADDRRAQAWLEQVAPMQPGFANWMIQDAAGRMMARVPWSTTPPPVHHLHDRDYFRGAAARAGKTGVDAVHISRVYTSTIDHGNKFAISIPIWDGPPDAPRLLGRFGSGWFTASTMGLSGRRTSLAGRADDDTKERYQLIFHPDYNTPNVAIPVNAPRLFEIQKTDPSKPEIEPITEGSAEDRPTVPDDDYTDPVAAMQGGPKRRWLAAFAPVGNTELVAIVQVPFDEAIEPDAARTRRIFVWIFAALALVLLLSIGWIRAARGHAGRRPPATTATRKTSIDPV